MNTWKQFFFISDVLNAKLRSLSVEFSRRVRELKQPSGSQGGAKRRTWRFFDSLQFLRDSVIPRTTVSNLLTQENTDNAEVH